MNEERGKAAFAIHEKIIKNEELRRILMAENAKMLSEMFEQGYYREMLGSEDGEWSGYLGNLEIFYTRSRVEYLRRVYARFTKELRIPEEVWIQAPLTRLIDILHIINETNFEDWISNAMVLTSRDWNIKVRKAKGKTTEDDEHKHKDKIYKICGVCGRKTPHHHDELDGDSPQEPEFATDKELDVALDEIAPTPPSHLGKARPSFFKKQK